MTQANAQKLLHAAMEKHPSHNFGPRKRRQPIRRTVGAIEPTWAVHCRDCGRALVTTHDGRVTGMASAADCRRDD